MKCNNSDEGCDWQGSVGTLDKHMVTCEFECVPCKYQYVGCDVKMTRKDITQHEEEDDKKHLHLALQSVAIPTLSDGYLKCLSTAPRNETRRFSCQNPSIRIPMATRCVLKSM